LNFLENFYQEIEKHLKCDIIEKIDISQNLKEELMKLSFRTIAKFCFLLVIIGFFMPICCDQNGFALANRDTAQFSLTLSLYALFISAVAGLIIGLLLLKKKNIPVVVDWLIILVCVLGGLIPFLINMRKYEFQIGLYVIFAGYALILITQVVSIIKKET
jgi:hypothetical protein